MRRNARGCPSAIYTGLATTSVVELALFNAVPATISLDGTKYFYVNPLRKVGEPPYRLRWSRSRQPYIRCFCCPPNSVRTIAESSNYAYSLSRNTLWLHLYGSNELDTTFVYGGRIRLTQKTDYPWAGTVRVTIHEAPAHALTVKLRVPGWADTSDVVINGRAFKERPEPGSYFAVTRRWSPGDEVTLNLPMRVRMLEANPLIEETINQVAIQRGPIVYCLESNDVPDGVRITDVVLPRAGPFTPRHATLANAPMMVLTTQALDLQRAPWTNHQLYREVRPGVARTIPITLIPYYAWGNRGDTEMSVWLPVR